MARKGKKIMRHVCWTLLLATVFYAGWNARGDRPFQQGFETGYEAASNHISTRIREGMNEMQPFYISDIGFRFYPRDLTSAKVRFIGTKAVYSVKAEVIK